MCIFLCFDFPLHAMNFDSTLAKNSKALKYCVLCSIVCLKVQQDSKYKNNPQNQACEMYLLISTGSSLSGCRDNSKGKSQIECSNKGEYRIPFYLICIET